MPLSPVIGSKGAPAERRGYHGRQFGSEQRRPLSSALDDRICDHREQHGSESCPLAGSCRPGRCLDAVAIGIKAILSWQARERTRKAHRRAPVSSTGQSSVFGLCHLTVATAFRKVASLCLFLSARSLSRGLCCALRSRFFGFSCSITQA